MQTCATKNTISGLVAPRVDERKRVSGICNVARPAGSQRGGDIVAAASADGTSESWQNMVYYLCRVRTIRFLWDCGFLCVFIVYLQVGLNGVLT